MEIGMKNNSGLGAKTVLSLFVYLSVAMLFSKCSMTTAEETGPRKSEAIKFASKLIEVSKGTSAATPFKGEFVQPAPTTILQRIVRSASSGHGSYESSCRSCNITKVVMMVQKPGCRGMKVKVNICTGGCDTWEIPDVSPRHSELNHTVCMPHFVVSKKIRLSRCMPGVNPYYNITYPTSCTCLPCSPRNMACRTW